MKTESLSKKAELKDLENAQPVHITKNENVCLEDNTEGMEESTICQRDSCGCEPQN